MLVANILDCQPFVDHASPCVSKVQKVNTMLLKSDVIVPFYLWTNTAPVSETLCLIFFFFLYFLYF